MACGQLDRNRRNSIGTYGVRAQDLVGVRLVATPCVVGHSFGKGEVVGSIPTGSTMFFNVLQQQTEPSSPLPNQIPTTLPEKYVDRARSVPNTMGRTRLNKWSPPPEVNNT
jgi:hypothetical protein